MLQVIIDSLSENSEALGTERDPIAAYGWLLLAKLDGKEKAQNSLDSLDTVLSKAERDEAQAWVSQQLKEREKEFEVFKQELE